MKGTTTITDKRKYGPDEWYCIWYECTCGKTWITENFSYCPNCGRKIIWKLTKDKPKPRKETL
jgi:DNA-directed RNA polymerase subunit RPC12/RpoP